MKYKIIPSIITNNQKDLDSLILKYKPYFKLIQLDIMDGKFVENKSCWFKFKLKKGIKYEAHLMINNPTEWIKDNYKYFETLIPNFEKIKDPIKLINFVKSKKKKIGFAINPETKIELLVPYLKYLDQILVLAVHPGQHGADFLPENLNKIQNLRKIYKKNIEVDGHVNDKTIRICKKAGANLFAVGSYLKNSKNLRKDITILKKELQ